MFYEVVAPERGALRLHPSRVVRFLGNPYPDPSLMASVWSDSVLQALYDAIHAVALTTAGATSLMHEAKVDVVTVPNLSELLNAGSPQSLLILLQLRRPGSGIAPSKGITMPYYTVPTPTDFAARFPGFAAVAPAVVANAIGEAQSRVDTTWLPSDYTIAIMLLAAHTMTLDGLGTGAEAASAAAGTLGYTSLRAGSLSLDRRHPGEKTQDTSLLTETTYGRRFLTLLKVNQPAVLVP